MRHLLSCFMMLLLFAGAYAQTASSPRTKAGSPKPPAKPKYGASQLKALESFKDSLLELKAAASVGVTRDDYQKRLQVAEAEKMKTADRLGGEEAADKDLRFLCLATTLMMYRTAGSQWDVLVLLKHPARAELSDYEEKISGAEEELQQELREANTKLTSCNDTKARGY